MSFHKLREALVCAFSDGVNSEEEFLILYEEYESTNLNFPHWKYELFSLDNILGDPGADSGGEGKSKRAEKYMERSKVKNGEKSPWGQCLTRPVPNGRRQNQSEARTAATVC